MCCIFPCPCPLKEKKKGKKESCPLLLCLVSLCVDALYLTACLRYFGGCFFPTSSSTSVVLLPGRQPWPNQNIRSLHVHCTSLAWCWDLWADTRKAAMFQTEVWLSSTCEAVLYYKQQVCPSSQAVVLQELSGLWMGWSGCDTAKTWGPWKAAQQPRGGGDPRTFQVLDPRPAVSLGQKDIKFEVCSWKPNRIKYWWGYLERKGHFIFLRGTEAAE